MKYIKNFKLFENINTLNDDVYHIDQMLIDIGDDLDTRVVGSKNIEDGNIFIDIFRNNRKSRNYIKLNDVKNKIKQIIDSLEIEESFYDIDEIRVIYLDRLGRQNNALFKNVNKLDIDELLKKPATKVTSGHFDDTSSINIDSISRGGVGKVSIILSKSSIKMEESLIFGQNEELSNIDDLYDTEDLLLNLEDYGATCRIWVNGFRGNKDNNNILNKDKYSKSISKIEFEVNLDDYTLTKYDIKEVMDQFVSRFNNYNIDIITTFNTYKVMSNSVWNFGLEFGDYFMVTMNIKDDV